MPGVTGLPVDSRWPLLDTRLLSYVLSVPSVPWCQQKEIVRRAFAAELPPAVIRRPKTVAWISAGDLHGLWHEQQRQKPPQLSDRVGDWVDLTRVRETLRTGTGGALEFACNVLALDVWLTALDRDGV